MPFLNQVVLITGAGSGVGESIALQFAKNSARLALVDIDAKLLNKSADTCEKVSKTTVLRIPADLTKDEEIRNLVQKTKQHYGKIDVVVNSAGICRMGSLLDLDAMQAYDDLEAINLRAIVSMTSAVAHVLTESKGCIVNICSVASATNTGATLMYETLKAALAHFTRGAALELAPAGVRVNAVLPGAVKTNILLSMGKTQAESDKMYELHGKSTPLKRCVTPDEVASVVTFLASENAVGITGVNYVVDAGYLLK